MKQNIKHIILESGLHCIHVGKRVHVYTENEYEQLTWWNKIKMKYFKIDD